MARLTDPHSASSRPPVSPALQQRAWAALMLSMLSRIGLLMMSGNIRRSVVVVVVALVIGATGLGLAISALSRARRDRAVRPRGAVTATVLGVIGCLFSAAVLIGLAMFWPQLTQYSQCLNAANTVTARSDCTQQLQNSLGTNVGLLGG